MSESRVTYTVGSVEEWKGHSIYTIWETDANGTKRWKKPLISFGLNKAQAILEHSDEINEFIKEEQSKPNQRIVKLGDGQ